MVEALRCILAQLHNASQLFKSFCVMKYLIDKNAAVIPTHEIEEACVSVWLCLMFQVEILVA